MIITRNPAGKRPELTQSVQLHLLGGLDRPDSGEIRLAGQRVDRGGLTLCGVCPPGNRDKWWD